MWEGGGGCALGKGNRTVSVEQLGSRELPSCRQVQSQQPCPLAQCRPRPPPPPQVLSQVAEVRLQVHGLHGSLQGQAEALTRLRQSAQAAKEGALVASCR